MTKKVTIEAKKAFVRKQRSANYAASLRLEGFKDGKNNPKKTVTKAELVAKYTSSHS